MATICLVDDDVYVRDALALGLGDAGFDVVVAPGAAAGLDLAARHPVDAIVTDMNMPGTHGSEFIAEARERWPDLPIIAISGAGMINGRPMADVARDLGANEALMKPFRANELADMVTRLLESSRPG